MEAEVIRSFIPDLLTAISDCVQSVSDQCLAKGLIPDTVYKRVLESGGTSDDKARTLILAVKTSTETDNKCLEIFLKILEEQLPYEIKGKLLSKIRNEIAEKTITEAEVLKSTPPQSIPNEELAKESFTLPSYLLGRFEKAVREHESACTEKRLLEEKLKAKSTSNANGDSELKVRMEQIENRMGKLDMQVRRDRGMVTTATQEWFTQLAKHHQQQTKIATRKTEEAIQKKMEDQKKAKELEHKLEMQEKDRKLEILHKDLQARELQVKSTAPFDLDPPDRLKAYCRDVNTYRLLNYITRTDVKDAHTYKWRDLGSKLGFSKENMDKIESQMKENCPSRDTLGTPAYNQKLELLCSEEMLKQWLDSYPGDSRGSKSFATYTWFKTALVEAGLGAHVRDMPPYERVIS